MFGYVGHLQYVYMCQGTYRPHSLPVQVATL